MNSPLGPLSLKKEGRLEIGKYFCYGKTLPENRAVAANPINPVKKQQIILKKKFITSNTL